MFSSSSISTFSVDFGFDFCLFTRFEEEDSDFCTFFLLLLLSSINHLPRSTEDLMNATNQLSSLTNSKKSIYY